MHVPFGKTNEASNIRSPFANLEPGTSYTDTGFGGLTELQVPLRTLVGTPNSMTLDDPDRTFNRPFKSFIVRTNKKLKIGQPMHYAIIVSFLCVDEGHEI